MRWHDTVHRAVYDNSSGMPSSTRIAVVVASFTLSLSNIVLTVAVLWQPELIPALSVGLGALGGVAAGSYIAQRAWSGPMRMPRHGQGYEGE